MRKIKTKPDKALFVLTLALTLLGLLAIADASAPQASAYFNDSYYFVKQQAIWGGVGVLVMLLASQIHYSFWKKIAPLVFIVSIILLIVVLLPGVGSKFLGARRWIYVGPVNFQPSEFVKLALALAFAWAADKELKLKFFLLALGIVVGLIMLQPDLGTAIIVVGIGFAQIFLAGFNIFLILLAAIVGAAIALILSLTSEYRRDRLLTFIHGSSDPLGTSYHIRQVLIALGSGGLLGVGLGQSRQKYLFLPEAATDSVFAVIAEEVGFIGAAILIILLTIFVFKMIKIARLAPDTFSKVLAGGIAAWIGGQMFLNIASMLALTPLTGVPLPFFSYGGSSLTMVLFAIGIMLNISKNTHDSKNGN